MASIEYSELTKVFDDGTVAVESWEHTGAARELVGHVGATRTRTPPAPARPLSCA